jgi:hypothetical protein
MPRRERRNRSRTGATEPGVRSTARLTHRARGWDGKVQCRPVRLKYGDDGRRPARRRPSNDSSWVAAGPFRLRHEEATIGHRPDSSGQGGEQRCGSFCFRQAECTQEVATSCRSACLRSEPISQSPGTSGHGHRPELPEPYDSGAVSERPSGNRLAKPRLRARCAGDLDNNVGETQRPLLGQADEGLSGRPEGRYRRFRMSRTRAVSSWSAGKPSIT